RFWERILAIPGGRRWIGARASRDVLEIGVGTGLNLPFYGADAGVTGVDLSPAMLAQARKRAAELGRDMDLREGDAQVLEFPDERFDTVVFGLSLCSIPDDRKAVAEGFASSSREGACSSWSMFAAPRPSSARVSA